MSLSVDLKIEALSSLFGQKLQPYNNYHGIQQVILSLEDIYYSIIGTHHQQTPMREFFIDVEELFDPQYDFDFTNLSDFSCCVRGNEPYERPRGWYRIALKVKGKYSDGDAWLGTNGWRNHSVYGEWPVSYHGSTLEGVKSIIGSHYVAGERAKFGRGIYSTPDIHVAESEDYAKTFTSSTTGKRYKVILQNRINPVWRYICPVSNYWLIPVPVCLPMMERYIAESSIRPYGILIKEV